MVRSQAIAYVAYFLLLAQLCNIEYGIEAFRHLPSAIWPTACMFIGRHETCQLFMHTSAG